MTKQVVVLHGDGIGVEVTEAALAVSRAVAREAGFTIKTETFKVGGASLDAHNVPIKDAVIHACKNADAVFLGAVGGPRWDNNENDKRPEIALLRLREELGLFTNLRPVQVFEPLLGASTLRPEIINGCNILIVRELTGGIYFGKPKFTETTGSEERAVDTMEYRTSEIERIAKAAFEAASARSNKVTSVDKANILATSQLWRKTVSRMAEEYPDIELTHMLVDNCAMQLLRNPKQFDVILTENMFGDILSDEASMLTGSLGMLPSASLGNGIGLYEPVHGTAPEIAGQNLANPLAAIASAALMFRFSFKMEAAAQSIENAIQKVLANGLRCADIAEDGRKTIGTKEMTQAIIDALESAK